MRALATVFAILSLATPAATASAGKPVYTVIYDFKAKNRNELPWGTLLSRNGVLYGSKLDSVFRLAPPASGNGPWTYDVIHRFTDLGKENDLDGTTIVADRAGALYGVVASSRSKPGWAYRLTPPASRSAAWKYEMLHFFTASDGDGNSSGLALGPAGELYGTMYSGGPYGLGTVFRISPPASPGALWKLTVLHGFRGPDGEYPYGPPTVHVDHGNVSLFGVTSGGGETSGEGAAYELTPPLGSQTAWTYTLIHSFDYATGFDPVGDPIVQDDFTVIGATAIGGTTGSGTVYALTPPAGGKPEWSLSILHDFTGKADGGFPYGSLFQSPSATLYGTAKNGGSRQDGVVFALRPRAGVAPRTLNVLYPFGDEDVEPSGPLANGLTADGTLALYGVTQRGRIYQLTFAP